MVKVGKIKGIEIELHTLFILVIGGLGFASLFSENGILDFLFIIALFGCVLLHELSHSIVALGQGVKVSKITLLPIGGVAQIENTEIKPRKEIIIALAGPIVNFALAFILALAAVYFGEAENKLLTQFIYANIVIGVLNMLPALPMDGGRVLRAGLEIALKNPLRATKISVRIGRFILAILFFLSFLSGNIWLMMISVFLYFGSEMELESAVLKDAVRGLTAKELCTLSYVQVKPDVSVSKTLLGLEKLGKLGALVVNGDLIRFFDVRRLKPGDMEKSVWEVSFPVKFVSENRKAIDVISSPKTSFTSRLNSLV